MNSVIRSRSLTSPDSMDGSYRRIDTGRRRRSKTGQTFNSDTWKALGCVTLVFTLFILATKGSRDRVLLNFASSKDPVKTIFGKEIKVSTWNVAAINNNPFEYWIDYRGGKGEKAYEKLMENFQSLIENPGEKDITLGSLLTTERVNELISEMNNVGMENLDEVKATWNSDFKERKIISEFLKDEVLGLKRLISMSDRVTNTMSNSKYGFWYRPTVINCYPKTFESLESFWSQWKNFMFHQELDSTNYPVNLLRKIPRSKYPALSEDEERISQSLQLLVLASFDTILVHLMNNLGDNPIVWQKVRSEICHNLNLKKNTKILKMLSKQYKNQDIIMMQEVSERLLERVKFKQNGYLASRYHVFQTHKLSGSHQNSIILLSREKFPDADELFGEVSSYVLDLLPFEQRDMVADGDLLVIQSDEVKLVIASFHGDTNGLASKPVLKALNDYVSWLNSREIDSPKYSLLFGLDANTYEIEKTGKNQAFSDFVTFYRDLKLSSCWESRGKKLRDFPNPQNYTTFNARTFLQPQLNKAAKKTEFLSKGDVNPKDFIIFSPTEFSVEQVVKDNTGKRKYVDGSVFPTLKFPSDHAILSVTLTVT